MNSGRRITSDALVQRLNRDKQNTYDPIAQQEALQNYLTEYNNNQSPDSPNNIAPTIQSSSVPNYTQEEIQAKWYEKLGNMLLDFGYDLSYGDVKSMEGVLDFFMSVNPNWKEIVEADLTAELFGEKYLGATERKQARQNASYAADLDKATGGISSNVVQAIGGQLPRIAVTLLTGVYAEDAVASGSMELANKIAKAGKIANTAMFTTSAYGSGVEEAYKDGANYGQAQLYGALSASIELLTEQLDNVLSFGEKSLFKGVLDDGIKKVTNGVVGRVLIGMAGEGLEEVLSDIANPVAKYIAYQKANGAEGIDWASTEELWQSFLVGALSAGAIESGNIAVTKGKHGSYTVAMNESDIQTELRNLQSLAQQEQKLADKQYGFLSQEQIDKFSKDRNKIIASIEKKLQNIENRMNRMSKEKAEKVKNSFNTTQEVINKDTGAKELKVKKNVVLDSYDVENGRFNDTFKATFHLDKDPIISKDGKVKYANKKFNLEIDADAEITNKIRKNAVRGAKAFTILTDKSNSDVKLVFTDKLNKGENGRYDSKNKTLYINVNSNKAIPAIVGHEFTHSLEGTTSYDSFKKYVIDQFKKDNKLLNEYYKELDKRKVAYERKLGKELTEDYINDEILADFVGDKLISNEKFLNELRNDKPKLFEKLETLVGKLFGNNLRLTKEEREELQKAFEEFTKVLESEDAELDSVKNDSDIRYSLNFSEEIAEDKVYEISGYQGSKIVNSNNIYDLDKVMGIHYFEAQKLNPNQLMKPKDKKLESPAAYISNVKKTANKANEAVFDLGEIRKEFEVKRDELTNSGDKTGIKYVKVNLDGVVRNIATASFFSSNQTITTTGKLKAEFYKWRDENKRPKSTIIFTGNRGESFIANTYTPAENENYFEAILQKKVDKDTQNVVVSKTEEARKAELTKKYDGTRTIETRELTDEFTEEVRQKYLETKNTAADLVKKAEESPWESQIDENETEKIVNIAPYYASTITDNDSYRKFAKNFDAALDKLEHIAKIHGCDFEVKNSFGIYENEADSFFQNEPSFIINLGKVNMEVANYVASLFADAGFQQQEASISSRDVSSFEEWSKLKNKAIAVDIKFDSTKIRPLEVAKIFQEKEIDCTVSNGKVTSINFDKISSEEDIDKIVEKYKDIYDTLKERNAVYGKEFEKAITQRLIESNWLDEKTRREWYSNINRDSEVQSDTRSGRNESTTRGNEIEKSKVGESTTNVEEESNLPATKEPGKRRNSKWLETAKESKEFKANFTPEMLELLDKEELSYEIMGNKETVERAKIQVDKTPLTKAYNDIINKIDSGQTITQDDVAMATVVAEKLAKQNRYDEAVDLVTTLSKKLTEYGRTIQAASLINRLTPEGKLKAFEKARVKIDEKNKKVKSTERANNRIKKEMKEKYLPADINMIKEENLAKLEDDLKQDGTYTEEEVRRILDSIADYIKERQRVTEYNLLNILTKMGAKPRLAKKMAADFAYKFNQDVVDVEAMYDRYDAVIIPRSLAKEYLKAKTNEERTKAGKKIQIALAKQTKVSFYEKVQQWRYLAMLANPKTHIRNMVSNFVMHQVSKVKDAVATVVENTIARPFMKKGERANTFKKVSKEMNNFAYVAAEAAHTAYAESLSKYNAVDPNVRVFKGRVLEKIRVLNNRLLENVEDKRAFKRAFAYKFGKWATANGYTVEFLKDAKNESILLKGRDIALQEALEQTYKDYSTLVAAINQLKMKSKTADLLISTVMPFTKTPVNIARRGIEYSPLGLAKRIAEVNKVKSGQMSATTWVNKLSKNLTGTMITMLGIALAKMNLVSGAGDDDKEGEYEKQLGKKPFSIRIGDKYFTLDWLAPASIPFFTGVAIYDAVNQSYEAQDFELGDYFDIISSTLDPLTEMTFLQSLNSALASYNNNTLVGIGANMAKSYTSSFIPTILSQGAKVLSNNTRRTTATTGDSKYFINSLKSKIPFLYDTLEPYIDVWGREDDKEDLWINKFMTNMVYPFWIYNNEETPVDTEILNLYGKYGNADILPKTPKYYYTKDGEKIELSSKEYTQYKKDYGTFSYNALNSLFTSSYYKSLSDEEKEKAIKKVYDYALSYAKKDKVYTMAKVLKLESTFATHLINLSSLSTDEVSSKKDKTLQYINSLKTLSKPQKYLLMAYSGYKIKDNNTRLTVIKYLKTLRRTNGISKEEYDFLVDNYLS
jgi:hypothetical protein